MKDALVTILVAMAGAFWLYALRLIWLRHREKISSLNSEASAEPRAPKVLAPAPPRIQLEDYEVVPAPFTGMFHSPLERLIRDEWTAVWYVLATLAIVTLLTNSVNPTVLFFALQIPLVILCAYVVSPDPNVARRLPFSWSLTALLALFVYLLQRAEMNSLREALNNTAGIVAWLLIVYWIASAASWSLNLARRQKEKLNQVQTLELFALLCATWGAVFEIASLLVWMMIGMWRDLATDIPSVHALFAAVSLMKTLPVLRFLPLEIVAVSLAILTALRMKDDHYVPRSLDEFLPIREESFFAPFVMALRIPVWIVVVIIEFAVHFSRLGREAVVDFAKNFSARLGFIMIGFVLAPILFYLGHTLMLEALHLASLYYKIADPGFLQGLENFFVINILLLLAFCCYVLAVPLLASRYRRVLGQKFWSALRLEVIVQGKAYVLAIGQTFSLLGVLAFAIPVVTFIPGGPSPGVFTFLYTVIVLVAFGWYVGSKDDDDENAEADMEEVEAEAEEASARSEAPLESLMNAPEPVERPPAASNTLQVTSSDQAV